MNPALQARGNSPRPSWAGSRPRFLPVSLRALLATIWAFTAGEILAGKLDSLPQSSSSRDAPARSARLPDNSGWEFRGMVLEDDVFLFCLRDPGSGLSRWLRLNEAWGDIFVGDYDPVAETLLVAVDEQVHLLRLKHGEIMLTGPAEPPSALDPEKPTVGETSEDAIHRQSLIREIRRRRAVHEAETEQAPAPPPGVGSHRFT